MTKKEIKEKIDNSGVFAFSKSDLYKLFDIKEEKVKFEAVTEKSFKRDLDLMAKLYVKHGKYSCSINYHLLDRQKVWKKLDTIKKLHIEKFKVFEKIEVAKEGEMAGYVKDIENLEFKLQRAWGFPQDRNFHRWFEVPRCTCAKMDNQDRSGTEYRVYNLDCPVHGNLAK